MVEEPAGAVEGPVGVVEGPGGVVRAVRRLAGRPARGFAKPPVARLDLRVGHGAEGDRHAGTRPLRQVHLVDAARYDLLRRGGSGVTDGYLGENVTTDGVDLLGLGAGAVLRLGPSVELLVTGQRFPRHEDPETDREGLRLDAAGLPVGRVGLFAAVTTPGTVRPGDAVLVHLTGEGALRVL